MQLRLRPGLLGSVFFLFACSETPAPPPEPLDLPDWEACMENYGMDGALLIEASEGGDSDAMVCELAVSQGRGFASRELRLLYRLYRLREREPEGLDALARGLSRRDLAAALANAHDFSPELDAFETDWRGCPRYDPIARELLLRAEPGEGDDCLPKRWWFWG